MPDIVRIPALDDNYIWLVHEPVSDETMVVDPAVAEPVLAAAKEHGWRITQIWNTHWHGDHTGGNEEIKAATGCIVTGPAAEAGKIPTARSPSPRRAIWSAPGRSRRRWLKRPPTPRATFQAISRPTR